MHAFLLNKHLPCDLSVYLSIWRLDSRQYEAAENFLVNKNEFWAVSLVSVTGRSDREQEQQKVGRGMEPCSPALLCWFLWLHTAHHCSQLSWEEQQGFLVPEGPLAEFLQRIPPGSGYFPRLYSPAPAKPPAAMETWGQNKILFIWHFFLPPELVCEGPDPFVSELCSAHLLVFQVNEDLGLFFSLKWTHICWQSQVHQLLLINCPALWMGCYLSAINYAF